MQFQKVEGHPDFVLDMICNSPCRYLNLAFFSCHLAGSYEARGMKETSTEYLMLLDRIYAEELGPEQIQAEFHRLLGADESGILAMVDYMKRVDLLMIGSLSLMAPARRMQFIRMTFEVAKHGYYTPHAWTKHFVQSALISE